MNTVKDTSIASKLLVILLVLFQAVVEIRGAPVTTQTAPLVTCPPPTGKCWHVPEDRCSRDSQCEVFSGRWIGLCCPHACGVKTCRDFLLPKPPTTIRSTTTEYTTQPSTSTTKLSTTNIPPVTPRHTEPVTVTTHSTNEPTNHVKQTSTKESHSTETWTTPITSTDARRSTTELSTKDMVTTTVESQVITTKPPVTTSQPPITTTQGQSTTLPEQTTTEIPTASSTKSLTTQKHEPDLSICSRSNAKNILFIVDGTVNYREYRDTRRNQFQQIKQFLKAVISELKGDKFSIGVLQYGGRREPRMEVDFWESRNTGEAIYQIDSMSRMGGKKIFTGKALAVASNKLYELNSFNERANAQDIIVLITRGRPSDNKQTTAEVEMLRRRMVRVIAVGLGSYPKYLAQSLQSISSSKKDVVFSKFRELANKKTSVLEKICLPVKLAGTPSLCRNKKYDIQFVLDGSRSIKHFTFDEKRKFLRDVFFLLESPSSNLNIGISQFSTVDKNEELLQLEKHSFGEELHVIENMDYHSGRRTMLGDALSRVNNEVFNGNGGDRSTVENVLVIFSDGQAHDIYDAYEEVDSMKERNVRVLAITANRNGYIPNELKKLATDRKHTMSVKLNNSAYFAKEVVSIICETEE